MALKFYTSVAKGLELITALVEVTGEKLGEGHFWPLPILNRVNNVLHYSESKNDVKKREKNDNGE